MEQMVETANQLISVIVDYTAFFLIYGAIFYLLGYLICAIVRGIIKDLRPVVRRWYQSMKGRKQ